VTKKDKKDKSKDKTSLSSDKTDPSHPPEDKIPPEEVPIGGVSNVAMVDTLSRDKSRIVTLSFRQVSDMSGEKVYKGFTESQIRSMSREERSRLKLAVSNNEIYQVSEGQNARARTQKNYSSSNIQHH
jgi:hypothetical protein